MVRTISEEEGVTTVLRNLLRSMHLWRKLAALPQRKISTRTKTQSPGFKFSFFGRVRGSKASLSRCRARVSADLAVDINDASR